MSPVNGRMQAFVMTGVGQGSIRERDRFGPACGDTAIRATVSGCVEPRINGEQRSPLGVIRGAGGDSERWVGV